MKKTILLLVVSIMMSSAVYAQTISQQWIKTYGGGGNDIIFSFQPTIDGGYIAVGQTDSFAPGLVVEAWILKLDVNGDISWQKTYRPGTFINSAYSIQQTTDGGYIVGGFGLPPDDTTGWLLKLDAVGNVIWQKAYTRVSQIKSIQQTADGGYIVGTEGAAGILAVKLDNNGDVIWQRACSEGPSDSIDSLKMTSDGGYIVVGFDSLLNAVLVSKLDSSGNIIWQKRYSEGRVGSIKQTSDGGFILAGEFEQNAWVLKVDENGNSVWQKTYGGDGFGSDGASSIQQTSDGGYIMLGNTTHFGSGIYDVWLLKLDSNGEIIWQKTYGGSSSDLSGLFGNTMDGGYVIAGSTDSFGAEGLMILKLDGNGEISGCDIVGTSNAIVSDAAVESQDINATNESLPITAEVIDGVLQDVAFETSVICQYNDPNDIDGDGVANNPDGATASSMFSSSFLADDDNCPTVANGPFLGTCIAGNIGSTCIANEACGVGGLCSMNQEDTDGDGIGDVCDSSTEQIPTLSEWGMIIFMIIILGIGVVTILRRRMI